MSGAARVYVTPERSGTGDRTSILDGGLEARKAEGRPVTREVPKYRHGKFTPRVNENVLVELDYVAGKCRSEGVRLVDERPVTSTPRLARA